VVFLTGSTRAGFNERPGYNRPEADLVLGSEKKMNVVRRLKTKDGILIFALAFASLCFLSLNYDLALDGAETTYFGFPFPWNSRGIAVSLEKKIYVIPLVFNMLFWTFIGKLVLQYAQRLQRKIENPIRWTILGFGLMGMGLITATLLFNETLFCLWPQLGPFHVVAVRLGFGV
jgi:hypothetical protein